MSQFKNGTDYIGSELLHTPGGVRDTYGVECENKLDVAGKVHDVMKSYGFDDIQTPTFEYFDIFSKERGTASSKEMFKFFDRGNNTLVLRPDMTPPIARCVAKYYREEQMQVRLCYTANTFVNTDPYKGKLQEVTQVGAELFGDASSDADAEMIALTVESLLSSGLKRFQLEIGHADLFRGIVEEAGFTHEETEKLHELIESKNFFGVEDLLDNLTVSEGLKEVILKLPDLLEDFDKAAEFVKERCKNERVLKALDRLAKLNNILKIYGFTDYVTIDLSMLSHYSYYTGVIFRAYTYGTGEAVATGGRYDGLIQQLGGKPTPALGFGLGLERLLMVMDAQGCDYMEPKTCDLYIVPMGEDALKKAMGIASELREEGCFVEYDLIGKGLNAQMKYANKTGAKFVMVLGDNEIESGVAKLKNMATGEQTDIRLDNTIAENFSNALMADMFKDIDADIEKFIGKEN